MDPSIELMWVELLRRAHADNLTEFARDLSGLACSPADDGQPLWILPTQRKSAEALRVLAFGSQRQNREDGGGGVRASHRLGQEADVGDSLCSSVQDSWS